MGMIGDILGLLKLFASRVPDRETHEWVISLVADEEQWVFAHECFQKVRVRNLEAIKAKDKTREVQYCFEEVCLKSVWNETHTDAPFDPDSPHWITKNAISLARALSIPDAEVIRIVAPLYAPDAH